MYEVLDKNALQESNENIFDTIDTDVHKETVHTEMDDEELQEFDKIKNPTVNKAIFTVLTNGIGFDVFSLILAEFGIKSNYNSTFYSLQIKLLIPSLDIAAKSCTQCYRGENTVFVSIDGAWSCPRDAQFCIVDLIDVETGKMFDFQIVTSIELDGVVHEHLTHSVKDSPTNFESIGTRQIARRNPLLNARVFVHDKDVKMKELLFLSQLL